MPKRKFLFAIFVCFSCLLCLVQILQAAPSDIIINEIGGYPTSTHEWVEIWNRSSAAVDIKDWKFWENNTNHTLAAVGRSSATINAGEYGAICQDADRFLLDHPDFSGVVLDSAWISLSEQGEEIGLKDSAGNFVEKLVYIPWSKAALERKDPYLDDYTANNWQERQSGDTVGFVNSNVKIVVASTTPFPSVTSTLETVTPTTSYEIVLPTSTPILTTSTPSPTSTISISPIDPPSVLPAEVTSTVSIATTSPNWQQIKINEFVSYVDTGQEEWVELFNTATTSITLNGLVLCDGREGSCAIATPTGTMAAGSWQTVVLSGNHLNNDADTILLKDPLGTILDSVSYANKTAPAKGNSLARISDGVDTDKDTDWAITTTATPGENNRITTPVVAPPFSREINRSSEIVGAVIKTNPVAVNTGVILNEIFPNPAAVADTEYIEIKNTSTVAVDISGWKIQDEGASYVLDGSLLPGQYAVFYRAQTKIALNNTVAEKVQLFTKTGEVSSEVSYASAKKNQSYSYDGVQWHWTNTITPGQENIFVEPVPLVKVENQSILKIQNPTFTEVGEKITLSAVGSADRYGKVPQIEWYVDNKILKGAQAHYVFTQPGIYQARVILTLQTGEKQEKFFTIVVGEAALLKNKKISLAEVYPNPVGSDMDEFIELFNNTTTTLDISGWKLKNKHTFVFATGTVANAGERLVFYRSITKLALSNTNELVELVNSEGQTIDVLRYTKAPEGKSFNSMAVSKEWGEPSPGEDFIESVDENAQDETTSGSAASEKAKKVSAGKKNIPIAMTVEQAREQDKDTMVKIEGQVTVLPGIFGSQYFYIQSASSGLQIYQSAKKFPNLKIGDRVEVVGKISEASGVKRVSVKNKEGIVVLSLQGALAPQSILATEIGEERAGQLVTLSADITEVKTSMVYIDDGEAEGVVVFKKGAQINKKLLKEGEKVQVIGVVEHSGAGWQIWPRSQADMVVKNEIVKKDKEGVLVTGSVPTADSKAARVIVIFGVGALLVAWIVRFRGALVQEWFKRIFKRSGEIIGRGRG